MRLATTAFIACFLAATTRAAAPATQPTGQQATAALLHGQIEFTPPSGWRAIKNDQPSDVAVAYLAADHDGYIAMQISDVVPDNAAVDGKTLVDKRRAMRVKAGQEIVLTPTLDTDARFLVKIHERYKLKSGKTADETHLYRRVEHRILILDVQSLSEDMAHVDSVRKSAEDMLVSVHSKGADPAASQPGRQVATAVLLKGKIEFAPPPADWKPVKSNQPPALAAVFITDGENTSLFLQVLPDDAVVDANAAKNILRQIRVNHQKGQEEMIVPPTLETDARFPIRIHERFKLKNGKTAQVFRMYRQLGGRVLELDVISYSDDSDHVDSLVKTGEDVVMSAHWKKGK